MIDYYHLEVIIELYGYFRLFCQCGNKGADAVILFRPALPFRFQGFVLLLHLFIASGVTVVPLQVFCMVLYLDGILLNALADQFTHDLYLFCQSRLLCIQFRAIAQVSLYQVDVLQNLLSVSH